MDFKDKLLNVKNENSRLLNVYSILVIETMVVIIYFDSRVRICHWIKILINVKNLFGCQSLRSWNMWYFFIFIYYRTSLRGYTVGKLFVEVIDDRHERLWNLFTILFRNNWSAAKIFTVSFKLSKECNLECGWKLTKNSKKISVELTTLTLFRCLFLFEPFFISSPPPSPMYYFVYFNGLF